jgi:hypothetical protein
MSLDCGGGDCSKGPGKTFLEGVGEYKVAITTTVQTFSLAVLAVFLLIIELCTRAMGR